MKNIGTQCYFYIAVNVICYVAAIVAYQLIVSRSSGHFINSGFFCDDTSIQYPYKTDTVDFLTLLIVGLLVDFVFIFLYEIVSYYMEQRQDQVDCSKELEQSQVQNDEEEPRSLYTLVLRLFIQTAIVSNGLLLMGCVTFAAKISIGRLRPNFLSVCQLVKGSYNCSDGFVQNYTCGNQDYSGVADSSQSFPSAHAAYVVFFVAVIAFFLESRLTSAQWLIPKRTLQAIGLCLAFYVCLSRINDHKHHPTDVIIGAIVGVIFGYATAKILSLAAPYAGRRSDYHNLEMGCTNH